MISANGGGTLGGVTFASLGLTLQTLGPTGPSVS